MLGKTPNKVYDYFLKAGLGYQNPERIKKSIAAQPKMYHGEMLYSTKLKIDSPDSKETLEDAEESQLKMRNKMIQLDYGKLNALYKTFVPQKESSVEQTYFSFPSTSNEYYESNEVKAIAWWIDSGATTHVCKDRCWFKTYEPVEEGSVLYMDDDHLAPLHGKGSNLISGPVLNKCGYKQVYESNKYILSKSGVFVGFGYYNNGMFMLNLNKVPDDSGYVYMSSSTVVNSSLWHARLGHVHYKRMLEMSKDNLIPVVDENPKKCTTCMLTKITRQPFKSITRKSVILELIHRDLCDFHATPSLGNKKYVITFIDDASRFCYVYLLHAKDEALDKFRVYKTEVELQQNDLIKTLRMDRGGEYYDPVFF
ncbi:zinc finger, CCHC-type containing protein [Tanacetum coccineum]